MQETFPLYDQDKELAGEGLYVSATTSSNKRYYGVLVDQQALKVASTMYFQDQSDSLKLNERMKLLLEEKPAANSAEAMNGDAGMTSTGATNGTANSYHGHGTRLSSKRSSEAMDTVNTGKQSKRARLESRTHQNGLFEEKAVQKFKYVEGSGDLPGYRILVATFSNSEEAGCGDTAKAQAIEKACKSGGVFLEGTSNDSYYYQYEVLPSSLAPKQDDNADLDVRTSMGFHSFLQNTSLPSWFPLSNLHSQSKVLSMMNLKRDNNGNVKWESGGESKKPAVAVHEGGTRMPMLERERKAYQIGVIGGGIAGLMCCQELITLLDNEGIDAKVTLMEARPRLGGRLLTDRSWKTDGRKEFPIELGASWIHGINDNPLANLATVAGIHFATASENVKMLGRDMTEVNEDADEAMGALFDNLLDHAAEDCWMTREDTSIPHGTVDSQAAVRFYGSAFVGDEKNRAKTPTLSGPPPHRRSNDCSMDNEIGKAIARYHLQDFAKLTEEENRMLLWYIKNIEVRF